MLFCGQLPEDRREALHVVDLMRDLLTGWLVAKHERKPADGNVLPFPAGGAGS
jgi:hypothetical protein